jgi:hypothetical protein
MEGATKCRKCRSFLDTTSDNQAVNDIAFDTQDTPCCALCLGLWQASFSKQLQEALEKVCEPYGGIGKNQISRMENAAPTVSVAGDVMLRYHSLKEKE